MNVVNPVQFFRFFNGRCHGNQFCGKITYPPALITLAFQNGMGHRYINVCTNSVNDASISYKNFLKFGPVTPELTELIGEHQVRHGQKPGAFSRISPDILDQFSQSLHHIRAFYVQMIIFHFVKGRCHDNQIYCKNVISAN